MCLAKADTSVVLIIALMIFVILCKMTHLQDDEEECGHAHHHLHFPPNLLQAKHSSPAQLGTAISGVVGVVRLQPVQNPNHDADKGYGKEDKSPTFPAQNSGAP